MKQKLTLLIFALFTAIGAWAESVIWESKSGWTQASGGMGAFTWYGVHTPGDASQKYTLTAIQLMQQTGNGNNNNFLAIARVSATSTLDANHVVAISDNQVLASSSTGSLETYNFSAGVDLLGGTTYYFVFLSENTPNDGVYTVRQGRLSLNHTDYEVYEYGNSANQTNWWFYYKATLESSSVTGFCTGDYLGGTSPSGNWVSSWSYETTPAFTITSNANNINNSSSKPAGGLDIRSGQAKSATYTIKAPTGYVITGYKLFGKAITSANTQTVTPAEGGSAVGFTGAGNSLSVSGLRKATTSFTLTGENTGLFLHAMEVSLTPYSSIASLPTDNNKAYVIANARATFNFADNATSMTVVTPSNTNYDNTQQQIAVIFKDSEYYLFSVNAGKYLTASNTLTSMPTDAEQVSIVATGNATYPWFFKFKNVADKNFNVTSAPALQIDSWTTIDAGNSNAIIEVADFDATQALEMFNVRNVTYNLSYGGNSTFRSMSDVTVTIGGDPADFLPSSFIVPGVSYSYSPSTIGGETTEVTVTATWNGPFNIASAYDGTIQDIWYVVDMHSNLNDYTWQYDVTSGEIKTPIIAKDAYYSLTDYNLWCFVGNPWDGFKIYNKAAGNTMTIRKADTGNTVSNMSTTDDHNQFKFYTSNNIANAYCFKLDGDDYYLNEQNQKLQGWTARDQGSSCRFFAPGAYYIAALNAWNLDAPIGAVGTKSYINSESQRESLLELRTNITNDPFCVVGTFDATNTIMNYVRESETITLADGYYRFVNAFPSWTTNAPSIYYNSAAGRIEWSKASNAVSNVNSIFKIDASTPSIYSPNAQKYMSVINSTESGSLDNEPGITVFTSLGSAQYNVVVGGGTMHTAGHSSGAGNAGNLTSWGGGVNEASAWYIVRVEELSITLNDGGDGNYYATMCLPFDVTLANACAYTLKLNGAKNGLTLSNAISEVPAGTPVLLRHTDNAVTAIIASSAEINAPLTTTDLTGTYTDLTVNGDTDYFLGVVNSKVGFYHWNGTTLKANRAYFEATKLSGTGVKGLVLDFEDNATGIEDLNVNTNLNDAIYNLAGQRLSKIQKGINIVNGKKILK